MPDLSHSPYQTEAASLLTHYFRTVFEAAGLEWNSDNTGEVEQIVHQLAAAAREQAEAEVRAHNENEPHLYADGSSA